MFGDLRQRLRTLEETVAIMASNQRQFAESLRLIVQGVSDNARSCNDNFDAIISSIATLCDRLRDGDADDADWWRRPHD